MFLKWQRERGTVNETTAPYSPECSGIAKILNGTLLNMARPMLPYVPSRFRNLLWVEVINSMNYIWKPLLTKSLLKPMMPYEMVYGEVPTVSNMWRIGSFVYTHIPKKIQVGKLGTAANEGILDGFHSISITQLFTMKRAKYSCHEISG